MPHILTLSQTFDGPPKVSTFSVVAPPGPFRSGQMPSASRPALWFREIFDARHLAGLMAAPFVFEGRADDSNSFRQERLRCECSLHPEVRLGDNRWEGD